MLPCAAALGDQPPARAQRRVEAREEALVVGDPVEDGGREDGVDRLVELQLGEVGDQIVGAVAEALARLLDHRLGAVDGDHAALGRRSSSMRGHPAGAAAGVEHRLVAAQLEPVEHLRRPTRPAGRRRAS